MPPFAAWKVPPRFAVAPVNAPLVWPKSSDSSSSRDRAAVHRHEGPVAARPCVDLLGDQLLAGARFAGDEHRHVGLRDLLHPAIDLAHRVAGADDRAEAHPVELCLERRVPGLKLVEGQGSGQDKARLRRIDGERLQVRVGEQVHDVVVPDVDQADELVAIDQRHTHHAAELQVHDREALLERGVVQRVCDDQRLARADHRRDDAVGHLVERVLDVLLRHVARDAHVELVTAREDQEPPVGVGQLDDGVHHLLEQLRDGKARAELASEFEDAPIGVGELGVRRLCALRGGSVQVEVQRGVAEQDLVAMLQGVPRAALAVDDRVRALRDALEREGLAVEADQRVRRRDVLIAQDEIVVSAPTLVTCLCSSKVVGGAPRVAV